MVVRPCVIIAFGIKYLFQIVLSRAFSFSPNAMLGTELAEFSESSCSSQTILIELPLAFSHGSEPFGKCGLQGGRVFFSRKRSGESV